MVTSGDEKRALRPLIAEEHLARIRRTVSIPAEIEFYDFTFGSSDNGFTSLTLTKPDV
jgi:hypothetical protein